MQVSINDALQAATERHRSGRLAEAEALYRQVLARDPACSDALHFLGILAGQVNQPETAVELIRRAVAINPGKADVWGDLGNALHLCGLLEEAIAAHRRALELEPNFAKAWNNLGIALHAKGQFDEAIAACREAVRLDAADPAAQANLGKALEATGRLEDAIAAHRSAVELAPQDARFYFNLGNAFGANGQVEEAIAAFREAVRLDPRHAKAHNNLGNALVDRGRLEEAINCYQEAIRVRPDYATAFSNLGHALHSAGRIDGAVAACGEALRLNPDDATAHNNLGNAHQTMGELEKAISRYWEAIRLNPEYATAFSNLGNALRTAGRIDEAVEACRRALLLNPDFAAAQVNLADCLMDLGQLDLALDCFRKAATLQPSAADHGSLVCSLHYHPGYDAAAILSEAREWERQHTSPFQQHVRNHGNDPTPDRRLRIGYVSPDFRQHVVAFNLLPLLREHDRGRFEIYCYSNALAADSVTPQIRRMADGWREIAGLTDERAAELIRTDQIDILIDLAMHTTGNRLSLFARKPAPVQATYLAYCSTTGLSVMDYRLSDPFLDPPETDLNCYSEQTIRLPRAYWCYQPGGPTPEATPPPALSAGAITFGCLNNFTKVSKDALDLWLEILRAAPQSRLLLQAPQGSSRQRVAELVAKRGLSPERLEFVGKEPWPEYVQNWQRIDIGLDPFPYGGGITTCDALWMGVPIVSLSGRTAVGRGGRSILSNVGLPELVARAPRQYLETAISLAGDLPRLTELRSGLRERLERSALRDAPSFARDVEAAYRQMWRAWCTGEIDPQ